jgi:hypothetical protein
MDLIQPPGEQPSLDKVRAQLEQWRHSRNKRKAIPDALWEAAPCLFAAPHIKSPAAQPHQTETIRPGIVPGPMHADRGRLHRAGVCQARGRLSVQR